MTLNGSEILVKVLLEEGVDTVFGYPGGCVLNIYDELYKSSDKIRHIMTAHEQGAAHAADGYARATGRTGVCIATSGPGATNLVTGLATAYMDSVPMVAITGNVPNSLIGRDSFQEVYITGITMPITKHNFFVNDVNQLADTLRRAFEIAHTGRFGPVHVDITKDVTAALCEYTPPTAEKKAQKPVEYDNLEEIAEVINSAERPFVYCGGGIRLSGAEEEVQRLIAKADIPASYTLMAAGVLGYGDRNNLGLLGMHGMYSGNKAIFNSDVMIALGTRFSDRVALNGKNFCKNSKIIHIDIAKSEIGKNVPCEYSVNGDIKDVLTKLLPLIKEQKREKWHADIDEWKKHDHVPVDVPEDSHELKPHQIIRETCKMAGEDAIYVTDVGQHQMWAAQYISHVKPNSFLTSGGLGTMGYGYGAAIGATIATEGTRPVIHFTGDGSFHMNLNEACTAVSYNVPVITVIMNNQVLGMVHQWQQFFYGRRFSSSEPERATNYKAVAEGFGAKGYHCETLAEYKAALAEALKANGPVWIECLIDRFENVYPMIPGGKTVEDTIINNPEEAGK
ncbi:MAG: biosynthetic-type acetolactate synthase large subunit [Clostridia bacterium]|nr:biosynthetic-type acetolactate synthase large subunit [Clostridia bacterium]